MKNTYWTFIFLVLSNVLGIAQDIVPPWIPITKEEIPDSIYDQEFVDLIVGDMELNSGQEVRYVFFVKFQFWEATQILENGNYWTEIHLQREPDSIEVIRIQLSTFHQGTDLAHIVGYAPDYSFSSMNFLAGLQNVSGTCTAMPSFYKFREMKNNIDYGFFMQLTDYWHPPVNTQDLVIKHFSIYPNPAMGKVSVEIPDQQLSAVEFLEYFDVHGKCLFRNEWPVGIKSLDLNTEYLAPGNYWLVLRDIDNRIIGRQQFTFIN